MSEMESSRTKLIGFDTETGGLKPETGIRTIFAVSVDYEDFMQLAESRRLSRSRFGHIHSFFGDPSKQTPWGYTQMFCRLGPTDVDAPGAILTTHLTPSVLTSPDVLTKHQVMIKFYQWMVKQKNVIGVGHNIRSFDIPFIRHAMAESLMPPDLFMPGGKHLDTLLMSRAVHHLQPELYQWTTREDKNGKSSVSMQLGSIASANGFPLGENAHNAAIDVMGTMPVLGMYASRSPDLFRAFVRSTNVWELLKNFTNPMQQAFYIGRLGRTGFKGDVVTPLAVCKQGRSPKAFLMFTLNEDETSSGDIDKLSRITDAEWAKIALNLKTQNIREIEKDYPFLRVILPNKPEMIVNYSGSLGGIIANNTSFTTSDVNDRVMGVRRYLKSSSLPLKISQAFGSALEPVKPITAEDSRAGMWFAEFASRDYGTQLRDVRRQFHAAETWGQAIDICAGIKLDAHPWMSVVRSRMLSLIGEHDPQTLANARPDMYAEYAAAVRDSLSSDTPAKMSLANTLADIQKRKESGLSAEDTALLDQWADHFSAQQHFWLHGDAVPDVRHAKPVLHLTGG